MNRIFSREPEAKTASGLRELGHKTDFVPRRSWRRAGFSLIELLAAVTILGIIAIVVIPRIATSSASAKANASLQNKAEINRAVERWYFETGSWPANDLSDIGADASYFPDGIPADPVDGSAYALDAGTHRVN